nr:MAG TPA: hypothetical protein [Crassvirales sp.]
MFSSLDCLSFLIFLFISLRVCFTSVSAGLCKKLSLNILSLLIKKVPNLMKLNPIGCLLNSS